MSIERSIRTCVWCGGEFMGYPSSKYCPDCRVIREGSEQAEDQELADEREGWRHMRRDATGTVIVPGGNVMNALDDLCAYEEACEAAGIHGPEALKRELEKLRKRGTTSSGPSGHLPLKGKAFDGKAWTGDVEYDPHAPRKRRTGGLHCESCGHFQPTVASGGKGICDQHPRRIRPEGGRGGKYVVLDEPRQCQARRVACGDWVARQQGTGTTRQQATGNRQQGTGDADCHGLRPRNDIKEGDHHA